jgi:hypothetical protein
VAQYYFNLVGQGTVITDREGVEIPEVASEQVIATTMGELRSEEPELFACGGDWSIEVVDELGRLLARFSF